MSSRNRHIGLEIEYGNLTPEESANIIKNLYGGEIEKETNSVFNVKNTSLGTFKVELDAKPIQELSAHKETLKNTEIDTAKKVVINAAEGLSTVIVPCEIVTPPIKETDIPKLNELGKALVKAGGEGTRKSFKNAFGLHINPEETDLSVETILHTLQAYLLLDEYIKKQHKIDLTRKITSFIDPFPKSFKQKVLQVNYTPTMEELIRDYHAENPTRNRPLDMLPLFATVNEKLTNELFEGEKINKRPTYHYRLPNCELSNPSWRFETELENWYKIENLAKNEAQRISLIQKFNEHMEDFLSFEHNWVKHVEEVLNA